jgi:hypothetical protein
MLRLKWVKVYGTDSWRTIYRNRVIRTFDGKFTITNRNSQGVVSNFYAKTLDAIIQEIDEEVWRRNCTLALDKVC